MFDKIESLPWESFDEEYPNVIMDLPTWVFVYATDSIYYKVRGYNNLPDSLRLFGEELLEIGKSPDWERYDEMIPEFSPDDYTDNQLIIHLKEETIHEEFLKPYKRYDLKLVRNLSPSMHNYWLSTFDETRITRDNLIDILKKDQSVVEVQANRRAKLRGER